MGCGSSAPAQTTSAAAGAASLPGAGGAAGGAGAGANRATTGNAKGSKNIDYALRLAKFEEESKIKLLFLGAGESGKSTIFKQMRLLYGPGRSEDDLRMYGVVARSNIVVAIKKLCILCNNLEMEGDLDTESESEGTFGKTTVREAYDELTAYLVDKKVPPPPTIDLEPKGEGEEDWVGLNSTRAGLGANKDAKLCVALHESIRIVWESKTMRKVWDNRASMNIVDGHKELLDQVTRIASPKFKPTKRDVLVARVRTTQIIVEKYKIKGMKYEMYDVGGQRTDRRKWIHCFDQVTAVIFVAALSEYDQYLAEASETNRMVEALDLFHSVINNIAFSNSSVLLFLNKMDVFAEKIRYSDIGSMEPFSDYSGPPNDFDAGVKYFKKKFKDRLIDDELNDAFIHVTCAVDSKNLEFVLDSTTSIIRSDNLKRSGFLMSD